MDVGSFARREKTLRLQEELLGVEEDRLAGRVGVTIMPNPGYSITLEKNVSQRRVPKGAESNTQLWCLVYLR